MNKPLINKPLLLTHEDECELMWLLMDKLIKLEVYVQNPKVLRAHIKALRKLKEKIEKI